MSTDVTTFAGAAVPAVFRDMAPDADDLSAGVSGGFAVISFRASKWRVKYQGEETLLQNAAGDPIASMEVVILRANRHITKTFYEKGYTDGAVEAPDCFSLDGITPDVGAPKPQAANCASCPKNVFGSRITPAGKKAKACQDNRRVAIVPVGDIRNDAFGGPMLLRIPAASLADLSMMGKNLKARGFPYNAVSVRIGFDHEASYPKLTFKPVRPLTEDEGAMVKEMMGSDKIERILAEAVENDKPQPAAAAPAPVAAPKPAAPKQDDLFESAPPETPAPKVATAKAKPATPAPAPVTATTPLDKDISDILGELDLD